jgi:histidinol-phosphate aminotransferase
MKAEGVLVRDRSNDPGCEGRVRITIGTLEQMKHAGEALKKTMEAMGAER